MNSFKHLALTLLTLALTSCHGEFNGAAGNNSLADEHTALEYANASSKFSASTPAQLRSINVTDLSAQITVSGTQTTIQANEDGQWLFDIELVANQSHSLLIEWFAGTHLLLEESGTIFADPANTTINPTLEYLSGGYPRFDTDCDGLSNLVEIVAGSDLESVIGSDESACELDEPAEAVELVVNNYPWIIKQLRRFDANGYEPRVVSYEQRVQIRTQRSDDLQSEYRFNLIGFDLTEELVLAYFEFINTENGKQIRFKMSRASDAVRSEISGSSCYRSGNENGGYSCTMPFDWQTDQWYAIQIEETGTDTWQANIRPILSNTKQIVATINSPEGTDWTRPQIVIGYENPLSADECIQGLQRSSVRFTTAVANGEHSLLPSKTIESPCLLSGPGSGEGLRTVDGELVYELHIGSDY